MMRTARLPVNHPSLTLGEGGRPRAGRCQSVDFGSARRGSLARLRHGHTWVVVAEAPECRAVGISGRAAEQANRARRLTSEDREAIRTLAETRSLRELAVDFGVSHETIRFALGR